MDTRAFWFGFGVWNILHLSFVPLGTLGGKQGAGFFP